MKQFEELGLEKSILKALSDLGFEKPTPIQESTIPLVIQGKDIIAGSATGSGKTLAFSAGMIHQIKTEEKGIKSLVLVPTRELAEQVYQAIEVFSKHKGLNVIPVYGGVSINPQMTSLKKADIVVGTPGRILDHINRKTIDLKKVQYLVLDEADRMLDMGFLPDVKKIMSYCPKDKQSLLFSATISPEITSLANRFMNDPVEVNKSSQVDPKKLKQVYYDVTNNMKFSLLTHLLKEEDTSGLVMIFCNARTIVDFVEKNLKKQGLDALSIHGGLTQARRNQVIARFNDAKKAFILVCTDVAARGLDIPGVTHVYNYDLPNDSKQYIHRIGRTARAGSDGKAVNILSPRDHENFGRILRDYDVKVDNLRMPRVEKVQIEMPKRDGNGFGRNNSHGRSGPRGNNGRPRRPSGNRPSGNRSSKPRRSNSENKEN